MDVNTMKKLIKTIQELKSDNRSGWAYLMIFFGFPFTFIGYVMGGFYPSGWDYVMWFGGFWMALGFIWGGLRG